MKKQRARKKKTVDILRFLPSLFRYADVSKLTSNPNVFLTRALKSGYVTRIMRGVYLNTFKKMPSVEEVACYLRTPSYISCEWALNYHNIILQVPSVCTVITLSSAVGKRNKVNFRGTAIEYSRVLEKLFYGFETGEGFNIASPEKALLDTVYLRKHAPFPGELELGNIDMNKLRDHSEMFPKIVKKKIKMLLER
ncbi:hypothetical protein BMS3Abin07_01128 [bacterium BMS3Abin07]|nr:hypothetical protein BMS3Abin07_01128 [bacterium BMS3Abin07]GBE31597.1 hypothetical protein BMS3Bbin05_00500 [bacterium BMS3Bbin05]HDL20967.1 hypothetical protein [Nitrospirota bacterium]HDO21551.1 hypothetical protein [Nitrospirota bacterium]HDZ88095.1 hypothetical protein [Nitrospirota bacterium]